MAAKLGAVPLTAEGKYAKLTKFLYSVELKHTLLTTPNIAST